MKKRILAFLCMIAILAVFAIPTYADPVTSNGYSETLVQKVDLTDVPDIKTLSENLSTYASGSAWKITDAAGLQAFSTISNTSDAYTFSGKTVYLANDIDMKGVNDFAPIANNTGIGAFVTAFNGGIRFCGIFDGQGHTIRNLVITSDASDCRAVALFGAIRGGGVQNLVIDSTCSFTYTGTSSYALVASVAGLVYAYGDTGAKAAWADDSAAEVNAAIINVKSGAAVHSSMMYAGGIFASSGSQTGYFIMCRNCTYTGKISGSVVGGGGIYGCWTETRNLLCKNCVFAGDRSELTSSNGKNWITDIYGQGKPTKSENNIRFTRFFVKAYQKASSVDGTFSLRFSTLIGSVENLNEIGIRLTVTDSTGTVVKSTTQPINRVYTSIAATVNGEPVTYTASELGGTYIACLTLTDIPDNLGILHFCIETYAITAEGTSLVLDQATVSFNGSTQI